MNWLSRWFHKATPPPTVRVAASNLSTRPAVPIPPRKIRPPRPPVTIDDPTQAARLVVESPSTHVRQLAAELIEDPVQLRQLLKQVRNKDKSVYKILKRKCDLLNAADDKAAETANEIDALCVSLERHGHRTYDSWYITTLDRLTTQWLALATPPASEFQLRAAQAISRCKEVIAAHLRQLEEQTARAVAQQAAEQAARDLHEREQQSAREASSARAAADAQLRLAAAATQEAEEAMRAERRAMEEHAWRQIGGLIRRANTALDEGNTQRAAGIRRTLEEKLPTAPPLPAYLTRRLQQLDDQLNELKQWKDYAVAPKRLELIEEMEALVGSTEDPKDLAERIKSLQQEWRTISKGIVSEAAAEWERFQEAAQAAYQPCRDYFEAQTRLREENLAHRKAVLERLSAFEGEQDRDDPDWRMLATVVREAPQEWRRHSPVDRGAVLPVQRDFDASMQRLQARLHAWYERNLAEKRALIDRARQLLMQDDVREAIEAVKRLQIQWKATGHASRDQDQPLWSEFRELCDAVFHKRQQAHAEYIAALESNKAAAVGLCEEAERLGESSGAVFLEGVVKIPGWRSTFDALGEMPRPDARGLTDRFERSLRICQQRLAEHQMREAERSFADLFEAGGLVHAYEWAVISNAPASQRELLKENAETFISSVPQWPAAGLQTIKDALANARSVSAAELAEREKALRTLCVRREIVRELPTPTEDESLRREYQVHRLMRGMGQGSRAEDDRGALMVEWIRIGAVSPFLHDSLRRRFLPVSAPGLELAAVSPS